MPFELTILGSGSATPTLLRNPTSQYLQYNKHHFLIDCGEGTQIQLKRFEIKFQIIDHIFISHLHGDHYLGLVGLISTMHLNNRKMPLFLYGPRGLDEIIITQFKYSDTRLNFDLVFTELNTEANTVILDNPELTVETIPLDHRIPCCGFLFREKPRLQKLIKEKLPEKFPLADIARLRRGLDVIDKEGNIIYKNEELAHPVAPVTSYAYCSDTQFSKTVIELVKGVSTLYHEATFLDELFLRAKETYHTTALEAGQIAQAAQVGQLIIGHFSARYKEVEPLLEEAQKHFPNTIVAEDGNKYYL